MRETHRVLITPKATAVVHELKQRFGPLLFHLSGGCCDGTVPLCLRQSEFRIGVRDVLLDTIEGVPFYVDEMMFPFLREGQITLDALPALSDSFSLECADGLRFVTSSVDPHAGLAEQTNEAAPD